MEIVYLIVFLPLVLVTGVFLARDRKIPELKRRIDELESESAWKQKCCDDFASLNDSILEFQNNLTQQAKNAQAVACYEQEIKRIRDNIMSSSDDNQKLIDELSNKLKTVLRQMDCKTEDVAKIAQAVRRDVTLSSDDKQRFIDELNDKVKGIF